jgi:hypothetical protein
MVVALRKPPDPALWLSAHAGEDIHEMDGVDFEDLLAVAFQRRGNLVELTEHYDRGADIVVTVGPERWSVQAKRWDQWVDRSAIDQAITGIPAYGCTAALVVTNALFAPDAIAYACTHNVALWDQKDLANLLVETGVGEVSRAKAPTCPRCHIPMDFKKGHGAFWGCPNYRTTGCRETAKYHHVNLKVAGHRRASEAQPARRRLFELFRR